MQSGRLIAFVAAGILCAVAVVGIVAVLSNAEDGAVSGKLIYVALVLTIFSLVCLAGVLLSVRRPSLALLGYATVVAGFAAFGLMTRQIWSGNIFLGGSGWEPAGVAAFVALALGQVSLALAWTPRSNPVLWIAYAASAAIVGLGALGVLAILIDDFEVGPRVYGSLAILYILGIALLPLFTLSSREDETAP